MVTETLKTMTKSDLIALLQKRNAEIDALRLELSISRADAARGVKPRSASYNTPGAIAYRQQCDVARRLAMSTGKATLVGRT